MHAPSRAGQPELRYLLLRAGGGAAGRGGALGGAGKRVGHVVPVAAAASVRAGRGGAAPSKRRRGPGWARGAGAARPGGWSGG